MDRKSYFISDAQRLDTYIRASSNLRDLEKGKKGKAISNPVFAAERCRDREDPIFLPSVFS